MIRTVVTGVAGRMGRAVVHALHRAPQDFELCGATEQLDSPVIGQGVGAVCGAGPHHVAIRASLHEALDGAISSGSGADAVIDFSHPEASIVHARICAERGVALIVGTTGLSREAERELDVLATKIPILTAPNMSVGVVLMQELVRAAARALGEGYDIEILEMHHRHKRDAPSGTALRLGEVAARALDRAPDANFRLAREGAVGPRTDGEIGIQSLRGGDCVGEHTVFFAGQGERLEITHRAFSRDQFARGALRAARFLVGKPAGRYGMDQVLGLDGSKDADG